jgi:hypothetical protein
MKSDLEEATMDALRYIPSINQILAGRLTVELGERLGREVEDEIREIAAWPIEKAWDYKPSRHPIEDPSA